MSPTAGTRRFHLIERLGTGGHSDVFLAEQVSPGGFRRRVALKLVRPSLEGRAMREAARRIRDEARILGLLDHPNVVRVLDLVRVADGWAVVMEPVPGVDLHRLLEVGQRVAPRPAFAIAAEVARALVAAWEARDGDDVPLRVIHRDIKPANVLLTGDGRVKVLDFGIASMNLQDREGTSGLLVGTIGYLAPERVRREPDTPASDVYALGATLVELLLGEPMAQTPVVADQHGTVVSMTLDRVRRRLASAPPVVGAEAIALLRRMLHVDAAERPTAPQLVEHCSALAARLEGEALAEFAAAWVPRARVAGQRDGPLGVLVEARTTTSPAGPGADPRWVLGALAAGTLGLTALGGAALLAVGLLLTLGSEGAPGVAPRPELASLSADPAPTDAAPRSSLDPDAPAEAETPAIEVAAPAPDPGVPAPAPREPAAAAPVVPAVAEPEPVEAVLTGGEVEGDGVAEGAPPAPAEVPPPPVEVRTPATPPMPDLVGTWTGTAAGSPMTLRITGVDGRAVTARAEITQGTTVRSFALSGTCSERGLVLEGGAGERFEATLDAGVLAGTWSARAGARPQRWRVDRG